MAHQISTPARSSCRPLALHKPAVKKAEITFLVIGILAIIAGALSHFGYLHGINTLITNYVLGGGGGVTFLSSCLLHLSNKRRTDTHAQPDATHEKKERKKAEFKERALETFGNKKPKEQTVLDHVNANAQREALEVLNDPKKKKKTVSTGGGGRTRWVDHKKGAPGMIWKKAKPEKDAFTKEDQDVVTKAQKICQEKNLYLLYVPSSRLLDNEVLLQEKIELQEKEGDLPFQRGLFRWALDQPDMHEYMHELFRQLTIFICESGFSDVKYDNIALTKDGRIALFDLDNKKAVTGLVRGQAGKAFGLFGMIPHEWFNEFQDIVKTYDVDLASPARLMKHHKKKAENRPYTRATRRLFYRERGVVAAKQPLHIPDNLDKNLKKILKYINTELACANNYDLLAARKIKISYSQDNPMWEEIGISNDREFVKKFPQYLKRLKSLGYLIYAKEGCNESWEKNHKHRSLNNPALCQGGHFKIMV